MLRQWWVSWVGVGVMITFLDVARMVDATLMMGVMGWGGGDGHVFWRCTHGRCYGNDGCLGLGWGWWSRSLTLHAWSMLRQWWVSWVGVGVMVTFLDVAHMVDATAMMGVLGWGGGDGNVPWRCTHGRCYGNDGCLGLGWGWWSRFLTLHTWSMLRQWWVSWVGVGVMVTFLDVARMVDATAMMGVLGWGGGDGHVFWRCTHGRCYGNDGCLGLGWGWWSRSLTLHTVPMAQIHRSSVWCNVLARAVACVRTLWTQLKVKEENTLFGKRSVWSRRCYRWWIWLWLWWRWWWWWWWCSMMMMMMTMMMMMMTM